MNQAHRLASKFGLARIYPMKATRQDYVRQWTNLIASPLMWVLSSISFIMPSARTASEFSDMSANWLVPWGPAFSIWFPIFIGCIAYGIVQAMGSNRTRVIFRKTGWWTAAGFIGICIWSLITAFAPDNFVWTNNLIFIPSMICLVQAMVIFSKETDALDRLERLCVSVPIGLIAGWCSLAVFIGWSPVIANLTGMSTPLIPSMAVLCTALIWVAFNLRRSEFNTAYLIPPVWGLSFLAIRHFMTEPISPVIGGAAIAGAVILLGMSLLGRTSAVAQFSTRIA